MACWCGVSEPAGAQQAHDGLLPRGPVAMLWLPRRNHLRRRRGTQFRNELFSVFGSTTWKLHALLYFRCELLPELPDFRRNHISAVGLPGMIAEIVLVIVLGDIEGFRRPDFGDDRPPAGLFAVDLRDHLLRDAPLLLAVIEDRGAVLRAGIVALAIH